VALGQERGEFGDRVQAETVGEVLTSCPTDTLQRWILIEQPSSAVLEAEAAGVAGDGLDCATVALGSGVADS
jgi:hypothetical protein